MTHSHESEIGVLGSCLLDSKAVAYAIESRLTEAHFYERDNVKVWEAITLLVSGGHYNRVDTLTVQRQLKKLGYQLPDGYLDELIDKTPTAAHVEYHVEELRKCQVIRQALGISDMIDQAVKDGIDADALLTKITKASCRVERQDYKTAEDSHQMHIEHRERAKKEGLVGYPTCIGELGRLIGSYQPPDNIVVAAKSSVGKTDLVLNEFIPNAQEGVPVGLFSTDMSMFRMHERCASNIAGVNPFRFNYPQWTDDDAGRMDDAFEQLKELPIYINDNSHSTIFDIVSQATSWAVRYEIKMFCMDFLQQIVQTKDELKMPDRRVIGLHSNQIKDVGKRFNMVTFLISQLARYGDKSSDKTAPIPTKELLKESGDIENNADVVMLLAPEPGRPKDDYTFKAKVWDMVINVDKARNGPTGIIPLSFYPSRHRFMDRAKGDILRMDLESNFR